MRWFRRSRTQKRSGLEIYLISDLHINSEAFGNPDYPNLSNPPMYFYTTDQKMEKFVKRVNEEKPDVVLCLGDIAHGHSPNEGVEFFSEQWGKINIKKSVTLGNHDLTSKKADNVYGLSAYEYMAKMLGYGEKTEVAKSKFNESFAVENVRFLNVDTNLDVDGTHTAQGGNFSQELADWVVDETVKSAQKTIIIFSHYGNTYLKGESKVLLEETVSSLLSADSELKLYYFYGHSHVNALSEKKTDIERFKVFNFPALVDLNPGKFYKIYVAKNGNISIELDSVAWT